jgi:hypothetical protein
MWVLKLVVFMNEKQIVFEALCTKNGAMPVPQMALPLLAIALLDHSLIGSVLTPKIE